MCALFQCHCRAKPTPAFMTNAPTSGPCLVRLPAGHFGCVSFSVCHHAKSTLQTRLQPTSGSIQRRFKEYKGFDLARPGVHQSDAFQLDANCALARQIGRQNKGHTFGGDTVARRAPNVPPVLAINCTDQIGAFLMQMTTARAAFKDGLTCASDCQSGDVHNPYLSSRGAVIEW